MPQGTESLAGEAREATKTILVVEDDVAIVSFDLDPFLVTIETLLASP